METGHSNSGPFRLLAALAFITSWLALTGLMIRTLEKIWPAMTVGDPASLAAGLLLMPMAAYLIQAVIYIPRPQHRPIFLRKRIAGRVSILLLPLYRKIEPGPALDLITTVEDRRTIIDNLRKRSGPALGLIPRLALLLDNRSPLEIILSRLMNSRHRMVRLPGRIIFLIVGPARQFMRLWGYAFTRLWRDPGPEDELTVYKRRVAIDLAGRAAPFGLDDMGPEAAEDLLARIWVELKRIHHNPRYGEDVGQPLAELKPPPEEDSPNPVRQFYDKPWLEPRYYGVYLDLSVTLAARTVDELYDDLPDDDTSLFYPPELGREVEDALWLMADRARLRRLVSERLEEGIVRLDGRPVPTWAMAARLFDLEGELRYHKRRIAAHHRRCRTAHLLKARRLGAGWPEYLRRVAGVLHFAEHAQRALNTATNDFERLMKTPEKISGQTADQAARLFRLTDELYTRLANLELTPELEVRPTAMPPLEVPRPWEDFSQWQTARQRPQEKVLSLAAALREKALTALLWAEDQVAERAADGKANQAAPPAPGAIEDFTSIQPPLAPPERVYSAADRLKVGFIHILPAALVLALLLWQSQTLGRSRVVVYNGLGREVTVWIDGRGLDVAPFGRASLRLTPGGRHLVRTFTGGYPAAMINKMSAPAGEVLGRQVESFYQQFSKTPATEVYNVAGAAPLMEWWSPGHPSRPDEKEKFLGRPRWLTTDAQALFTAPKPGGDGPVKALSGYGDLPPGEMLSAFTEDEDKAELIRLHALWDDPQSPAFWQWQTIILGPPQAAIVVKRLAHEPDFLEKCEQQLTDMGLENPPEGDEAPPPAG